MEPPDQEPVILQESELGNNSPIFENRPSAMESDNHEPVISKETEFRNDCLTQESNPISTILK